MAVLGGTAGADASVGGRFPALILALRWATVTTGAVLSLVDLRHSAAAMAATSLLCLYAGFRILRPLPGPEGREAPAPAIAVELAVALAAVAISGGFGSPYVFALLVPVLLAGFTQGYAAGFLAAGAASLPLLVVGATVASARVPTETASQVALVYAATGALAGYARRLFVDAAAEQASFEDRVSSLTEANALLSQLTQVARTLPSSLDLGETLNAAMGHLGQLFDFTGATVLVLDAATGTWRAEGVTGLPAPPPMTTNQLPPPLLPRAPARRAAPAGGRPPRRGAGDPAAATLPGQPDRRPGRPAGRRTPPLRRPDRHHRPLPRRTGARPAAGGGGAGAVADHPGGARQRGTARQGERSRGDLDVRRPPRPARGGRRRGRVRPRRARHRRLGHVGDDGHAGTGQRHRGPAPRRLASRRRHVDPGRTRHRPRRVGMTNPRLLLVDD